jgi:hypothetical protein
MPHAVAVPEPVQVAPAIVDETPDERVDSAIKNGTIQGIEIFAVAQTTKFYPSDVLAEAAGSLLNKTVLWRHKWPSKQNPNSYLGVVTGSYYDEFEGKLYISARIPADTVTQANKIKDILSGKLKGVSVSSIDYHHIVDGKKTHVKSRFLEVSATPSKREASRTRLQL